MSIAPTSPLKTKTMENNDKPLNGITVNGCYYECVKGECSRKCAFFNNRLCEDLLCFCTGQGIYFRLSQKLTNKLTD